MSDARETHAYLRRRTERDFNRWQRDFRDRCMTIYATETAGRDVYDAQTHMRVVRALEAALDASYGQYRGDPRSPLTALVAHCARRSFVLAFRQAVAHMIRHVSGPTMRHLRERAEDDQPGSTVLV